MKLWPWPRTADKRRGEDRPYLPPGVTVRQVGGALALGKVRYHVERVQEMQLERHALRTGKTSVTECRRKQLDECISRRLRLIATSGLQVPDDRDAVKDLLKVLP